ncbi:MAG: hypothetical protein GVY34_09930 [Alphaproteobacteria bacterium]|jgi:hypothetical protein|nr:hypothetical protein [Alphaproteobacteria bacterium]
MTSYQCMIDLKPNANELAFARAVAAWFGALQAAGKVAGWHLSRRKLKLAGAGFGDFLLVVEFDDMAQMDRAFAHLEEGDHDAARLYSQMHGMIDRAEAGLYRPFPDPVPVERLSLI